MNRFIANVFSVVLLQGLLTLVAFPVLVAWGIPLSPLGVIGNVLFTPVIILFLLFSALLVVSLPFPFLAQKVGAILDVIVSVWNAASTNELRFFNKAFLFSGYVPLALFFCVILFLVHCRGRRYVSVFALMTCVAVFLFWAVGWHGGVGARKTFLCGSERLVCSQEAHGVCIVDHGGRRQIRTLDSWARYRLPQFLAQAFGATCIAAYHLYRLTPAVCSTVQVLCDEGMVAQVFVHNADKQDQRLLAQIKQSGEHSGVGIVIV